MTRPCDQDGHLDFCYMSVHSSLVSGAPWRDNNPGFQVLLWLSWDLHCMRSLDFPTILLFARTFYRKFSTGKLMESSCFSGPCFSFSVKWLLGYLYTIKTIRLPCTTINPSLSKALADTTVHALTLARFIRHSQSISSQKWTWFIIVTFILASCHSFNTQNCS